MNEEERAEWLARAIDDLLRADRQSGAVNGPPAGWDAEEVKALMLAARARLDKGREAAHAGLHYEGAIWERVLVRLNAHLEQEDTFGDDPLTSIAALENIELAEVPGEDETRDLREIARLRRRIAEQAASIAESHREEVWQRVQARIEAAPQKEGLLAAFRRLLRLDSPGEARAEPTDDETLDGLIRLARSRREIADPEAASAGERQRQFWSRIMPEFSAAAPEPATAGRQSLRRKPRYAVQRFVAISAVFVLAAFALCPLPATGLADHPAAAFARSIGDHIGVTETDAPPPTAAAATVVEGVDADAAAATVLLGLRVTEPKTVPAGFRQVSSQVFPQAVTSAAGGVFVVTYESDEASVVIYQERASESDLAVEGGAVSDVFLKDGTPASYIEGAWSFESPSAGSGQALRTSRASSGLSWDGAGGQTLLFDRDGVRTAVRYVGAPVERAVLFSIANGMTAD